MIIVIEWIAKRSAATEVDQWRAIDGYLKHVDVFQLTVGAWVTRARTVVDAECDRCTVGKLIDV